MPKAEAGQLGPFSPWSGANHIAPPMPTSGERLWVDSEASPSDQTSSFRTGSLVIDLSWISLAALILVIVLSCTTSVNPGLISLALAWVIGVHLAPLWGQRFTVSQVLAGFPDDLFLTLVGVTLLFTLARGNGTLDQVVRTALRCCQGNAGLIPLVFFGLSLSVSSIGAGSIASAALIAPLAMAVAERANIPSFLMTLMVAHGCVAVLSRRLPRRGSSPMA